MREDDVELKSHRILSPVDPVWHPLVDLVSHSVVQGRRFPMLSGPTKNLVGHPVVQVQHVEAMGGGGERNHQVPLHHVEP